MKMDKTQAVKLLKKLALSCSWKKENLLARVGKYQKYPSLVKKYLWMCVIEKKLTFAFNFASKFILGWVSYLVNVCKEIRQESHQEYNIAESGALRKRFLGGRLVWGFRV